MTQFLSRENTVRVKMMTLDCVTIAAVSDEDLNKGDSNEQRREGIRRRSW